MTWMSLVEDWPLTGRLVCATACQPMVFSVPCDCHVWKMLWIVHLRVLFRCGDQPAIGNLTRTISASGKRFWHCCCCFWLLLVHLVKSLLYTFFSFFKQTFIGDPQHFLDFEIMGWTIHYWLISHRICLPVKPLIIQNAICTSEKRCGYRLQLSFTCYIRHPKHFSHRKFVWISINEILKIWRIGGVITPVCFQTMYFIGYNSVAASNLWITCSY